jgi:hypothetical protein
LFGNRGICLATGEFVWQQGNLFGNREICLATGEFVWQQGNLFGNRGICLSTGEFTGVKDVLRNLQFTFHQVHLFHRFILFYTINIDVL